MKKTIALFAALLWVTASLSAQSPYTQKLYGFRVEKDLVYGIADNYVGIPTTLLLDLYKPVGDDNPQRPLLVMVHGGGWLGGCKDEANSSVVAIAKEMAQRGYVVASVNYRLGFHKSGGPIAKPYSQGPAGATLYPADSMDVVRAMYRGQQDVKGAIRWLKGRHAIDSTCTRRVLVGGESAGAFLALAVAFLDRDEEKPAACHALPAAPPPASNMTNSYGLNCTIQVVNPSGSALQRPDLGPIDGTLNLNGYDANVLGVASFYGGVLYEAGIKNWLKGPDTPAVYFYHQTCDGIVPFGFNQPHFIVSNCLDLWFNFTPWHPQYPLVYGNGAIAAFFDATPSPINYLTDFDQCPPFNPVLAPFECGRYADNGSYHFVQNVPLRCQKMADFFSPVVNGSSCFTVGAQEPLAQISARIVPNPFGERLSVWLENAPAGEALVSLTDVSGKTVWSANLVLQAGENVLFDQNRLPSGVYVLQIRSQTGLGAWAAVRF
jgi:dienelactone hydrolase